MGKTTLSALQTRSFMSVFILKNIHNCTHAHTHACALKKRTATQPNTTRPPTFEGRRKRRTSCKPGCHGNTAVWIGCILSAFGKKKSVGRKRLVFRESSLFAARVSAGWKCFYLQQLHLHEVQHVKKKKSEWMKIPNLAIKGGTKTLQTSLDFHQYRFGCLIIFHALNKSLKNKLSGCRPL